MTRISDAATSKYVLIGALIGALREELALREATVQSTASSRVEDDLERLARDEAALAEHQVAPVDVHGNLTMCTCGRRRGVCRDRARALASIRGLARVLGVEP